MVAEPFVVAAAERDIDGALDATCPVRVEENGEQPPMQCIHCVIVAFEFEYAATSDDLAAMAPALKTFMGDVLLQSPLPIFGFQPYVTTGGGLYRETLGTHQDTGAGTNVGGGVKMTLAGPLRLRVDYRVFKLGSGALNSPAHRIYAGLNLKF